METLFTSAGLVAIAEIGDKTQLLALVLAARFRKPVPIILGILAATLANHALAAGFGVAAAAILEGRVFQIGVALAFLAMAVWALIPDKEEDAAAAHATGSVFLTTAICFFLVEIGDKTQVATALLAARYQEIALVTLGTTLGMMAANVPAVLFGEAATKIAPLPLIRRAAAALFALIGLWALIAAFAHNP